MTAGLPGPFWGRGIVIENGPFGVLRSRPILLGACRTAPAPPGKTNPSGRMNCRIAGIDNRFRKARN